MTRLARARVADTAEYGIIDGETFLTLPGHRLGDPVDATAAAVPLTDVELLSPTDPRTTLLMWRAFYKPGDARTVDHDPYLAVKATGAGPTGHGSPIVVPPRLGAPLAAEAELAVVIGRTAKDVAIEDAWDALAGLTVMNDVTAPTLIHKSGTWPDELPRLVSGAVMAKCFDTFMPFGPWIEDGLTPADVADGLTIRTLVNGEERLRGTTADFKFTVAEVVSHASHILTLHAGDVITLGTPGIVLVDVGDVVQCEVEGVGTLENVVVAGPSPTD